VKECPEVAIATQDDVSAATAVATVWATEGGEFVTHKVTAAGATVAAAAKNPDLIYKVALFQNISIVLQIYRTPENRLAPVTK